MSDALCVPPPDLRDATGWHWLRLASAPAELVHWEPSPAYRGAGMWRWIDRKPKTGGPAAAEGWRYVGPAVPSEPPLAGSHPASELGYPGANAAPKQPEVVP